MTPSEAAEKTVESLVSDFGVARLRSTPPSEARGPGSTVVFRKGEKWLRLSLELRDIPLDAGPIASLDQSGAVRIEPLDSLSRRYSSDNWLSAVASGVLFAFRRLALPKTQVCVFDLSGRVDSKDMDAIANAAALAVATIFKRELPDIDLEGWVWFVLWGTSTSFLASLLPS